MWSTAGGRYGFQILVEHAVCLPSRSHASLVSGQEAASSTGLKAPHSRYPRLKHTTGHRIIDRAVVPLLGITASQLRTRVGTRNFRVTPTVGIEWSFAADDQATRHAMPYIT